MDADIFFFFNQFAGIDKNFDAIVYFFAVYGIFLFPLFLLGLSAWRSILFQGIYALCIAYLANALIALAWYRERPFRELDAKVLLDTSALFDSFPSDHAALAASIAVTVFFFSRWRGSVACLFAALIALSRVVSGVHYVSDVLAGLVIGLFAALVVEIVLKRRKQP